MADRPTTPAATHPSPFRRAAISALWAIAAIALLSRINRPAAPETIPPADSILQTRIPRIDLDLSDLNAAIQSISKASGVKIQIDQKELDRLSQTTPTSSFPERATTLTDVSLQTVLDAVTTLFELGYRVEGQCISIVPPPSKTNDARAILRVYEIDDLASIRKAWNAGSPPSRRASRDLTLCFPSESSEEEPIAKTFAAVASNMQPAHRTSKVPRARPWANRVILHDTPEGHRRFQKLLSLLRTGNSESVLQDAASQNHTRR